MVVRGMMCWGGGGAGDGCSRHDGAGGAGDGCSRHDVLGGGGWLFEA